MIGGCFLYILKLHFYPEECDRTKTPYVDFDRVKVSIWVFLFCFFAWLKQSVVNSRYGSHKAYRIAARLILWVVLEQWPACMPERQLQPGFLHGDPEPRQGHSSSAGSVQQQGRGLQGDSPKLPGRAVFCKPFAGTQFQGVIFPSPCCLPFCCISANFCVQKTCADEK